MYELTTDEAWVLCNIIEDIKNIYLLYNERTNSD